MFCSCRISTDKRVAQSLCNSRAPLNFGGPIHISGMAGAIVIKFCTLVRHWDDKLSLERAWSQSCDVLKFSEMVQDKDTVTMEV